MGKAFKDAFDGFEIEPDADLWSSIDKRNAELGNVNRFSVFAKLAASIAVVAVVSAVAYFMLLDKQIKEVQPVVELKELDKPSVHNDISDSFKLQLPKPIIKETVEPKENVAIEQKTIVEKNIIKEEGTNKSKSDIDKIKVPTIVKQKVIPAKLNDELKVTHTERVELNQQQVSKSIVAENIIKGEDIISNNVDSLVVVFGEDKSVCFGEEAILEVEQGYFYRWNTGDIMSKIKVSPTEDSEYIVTVSNAKGKSITHIYTVTIDKTCSALFIPSAFTPNADGQNDVFKAEGNGIMKMRMFVFDKNGNKVFETNNLDDSWDGTFRGNALGGGMFFYHAEYTDAMGYNHVKKGQVTLIK